MSDARDRKPSPQSNWAGTITYTPASVAQPASVDELKQILKAAQQQGRKVRPRGTGHSWNDAIVTRECSINTNRLAPPKVPYTTQIITGADGKPYCLLSVPPGMNQGDFSLLAQQHGCPLPTQGPAPDITLSGFTANGCHGTGWQQPTIAELVHAIELQGPGGETLHFDATSMPESLRSLGISGPDMLNLVRVHLGALGVLSRITFKLPIQPFNLRATNKFVRLTEVLDRNDPGKLKALIEGHDYVELFWFPYNNWKWKGLHAEPLGPETDTLWVMIFDRTSDPPTATDALINLWNDAMGVLAVIGEANGWVLSRRPDAAPMYSSLALGSMKWKNLFNDGVVFKPRDAFLYQKRYFRSFLDLEFTIPMNSDPGGQGFADVVAGFYQLVDRMEAWRNSGGDQPYPINLNVHARFVKNSQAALSPAFAPAGSSTHTCYIEYLSYSHGRLTADYDDFSRDFYSPAHADGWKKYGGIPNWGKDLASVPKVASYVHGRLGTRLQQFLQVRDRIDPGGKTFTNDYLAAFFTGTDLPARAAPIASPLAAPIASPIASPIATPTAPSTRSVPLPPLDLQRLPNLSSPWTRTLATGPVELAHDVAHGVAYLLTAHGEVNVLAVQHDPATHQLHYTTVTPSQHLLPEQILDRVTAAHHAPP
ncbi:D-arabinono-1,4-lactone oxidase [Nannocystis sp.]|uniref:D-arabinono-1,4-lactone oxidase n=1 Tax=Nannocystis sp. TaxID=1962667 RepID=UPI0025DED372|nr:D-arabinono-1,4-lactone oxidase [Nannocystis sp.]MBK7827604.1 FAD-binding protein [Nannocystis sp.]